MSEISKELIENYRKIVLPFVSNRLYKTNFEGQGEADKTEFEQDFNKILDLAISALNPTGDCISREVLKDITYINKGNFNTVEGIREWIDNAPPVEPNDDFYSGYVKGLGDAKSDIITLIANEYTSHGELIPNWLTIGETKVADRQKKGVAE